MPSGTNGGGTPTPSIIAFNELYASQGGGLPAGYCSTTGPSVAWAYLNVLCATSTTTSNDSILSSPVLSFDGTKVAWVTSDRKSTNSYHRHCGDQWIERDQPGMYRECAGWHGHNSQQCRTELDHSGQRSNIIQRPCLSRKFSWITTRILLTSVTMMGSCTRSHRSSQLLERFRK